MANSNQVAWYNAYKTAVATMRNGGLNNTLVVDAPGCGQDLRNGNTLRSYAVSLQNADTKHNLLFAVHLYDEWTSAGASSITTGLALIKNAGIPLVVGEFSSTVDYASVITTCNSLGIGFMAWSWTGNNETKYDMSSNWAGTSLYTWGSAVINNTGGLKSAVKCSVY